MKRPKTLHRNPIRTLAAGLAGALAKLRDALAGLMPAPGFAAPQPVPVRVGVTHRRALVATRGHDGALR